MHVRYRVFFLLTYGPAHKKNAFYPRHRTKVFERIMATGQDRKRDCHPQKQKSDEFPFVTKFSVVLNNCYT